MGMYAAAAGLIGEGVAGFLAANAAGMAQKNLLAAANQPGVNLQPRGQEALDSQASLLPSAEGIASGVNKFQNDQLQQILEGSMPGYGARQAQQGNDIMAYLHGDVPDDVKALLRTNAAEGAVASGMPGSSVLSGSLTSNDWLKNLGLTSLGMIDKGMSANNAFRSSSPYISPMDITAELGPTPTQYDAMEERRIARRQALLAQEAVMPGSTQSAANTISQISGQLLGMGMGGMGGGGGMGGPSGFGGMMGGTGGGGMTGSQGSSFMGQFYGTGGPNLGMAWAGG